MPCDSSCRAQMMLLRSSNRAFSSTSTATCLPASAASMSSGTSGDCGPMRYSVILMAMTWGSRTAARRNVSTERERLERVVQQHVLIADQVEDRLRILVHAPDHRRRERRVLQVGPGDAGHPHPVPESQPIAGPEHHLVGRLEVLHQDVERALGHVAFDMQEGQRAVPQLLQAAVHGLQQVVALVVAVESRGPSRGRCGTGAPP